MSETDEMALVGSVSLMMLHDRFVSHPTLASPAEPTRSVVGDKLEPDARIGGMAATA